jgi:hypothetical protein
MTRKLVPGASRHVAAVAARLLETARRFSGKEAVAVKVAVVGTERAAGQHPSGGGR